MKQSVTTISLGFLCLLFGVSRASESRPDSADSVNSQLDDILAQLDSDQFEQRLHGREQLRTLTAQQITRLADVAATHPSAEVAARVMDALAEHYTSSNHEVSVAASDVLESLLECDRLLVHEAAAHTLSNHWKQRALLAIEALREHGALIIPSPGLLDSEALPHQLNPFGSITDLSTKVILTDEWTGDSETVKLFGRMPDIQQLTIPAAGRVNARFGRMISQRPETHVFLINGHSVPEADANRLRTLIGDVRVSDRGPVMLGISALGGATGIGCRIQSITPGASAERAGLLPGDVITGINDGTVQSFDDLVEQLRKYNVDDTVEVSIYRRGTVKMEEVRLRGWKEYVQTANGANSDEADP